jgi:(p)ppGpp synthase/HD superfamily hydrolase
MDNARSLAHGKSLSKKALVMAKYAHKGQFRKGSNKPYIIHPYSVYGNLLPHTADETVLAAALLHDVLEDVNPDHYSAAHMLEDFGQEVVDVVTLVTKDTSLGDWRTVNEAYIATLDTTPDERALLVCTSDKLDNLSTSLYDYASQGEAFWDIFHAGKDEQKWWYESVLKLLKKHMGYHPLVQLYEQKVMQLRRV